jgi:CRP-like cAMP-binding protein
VQNLQANQLLAQLPPRSCDALAAHLQHITLKTWEMLRDEHEPIRYVYFPVTGVISVVSLMEDGAIAESYAAGRDGMIGAELLFGDDRDVFRQMCQIPGDFLCMSAPEFRRLADADPEIPRAVYKYWHCLVALTGRAAACNLTHQVSERCARWLLISHDRVVGDTFELTQEVLSTMLGVRRPSVSIAAGALQKAGVIRYVRGQITVTDRAGLEAASCECYRVVADEFCRVLGGPQPKSS